MAAALVAVKQHHATARAPVFADISDAMPEDGPDIIVKAGILGRLTRRSENVSVSVSSSADIWF